VERVQLGELLKRRGAIDDGALVTALEYQRNFGGRLGELLVEFRYLSEPQLLQALGEQLRIPVIRIGDARIAPRVLRLVPAAIARRHRALPLAILSHPRSTKLAVAFESPQDLAAVDEVAFASGMCVVPFLAGRADLDRAIARLLGPAPRAEAARPSPSPEEPPRLERVHAGDRSLH
jgi:type IV pilus assembly protein PilB